MYGLALGALGVVYGDIGTSPLYAFRECFAEGRGLTATPENVVGVLSLILWSLIVVVTLKYLALVMRADNHGEGGILALLTLITRSSARNSPPRAIVALGLLGAALLYGDGMITPAISVLSAVEGLSVATPALAAYVVPVAVGILVGLFLIQSRGTQAVGAAFGPVTAVWFVTLAILGGVGIARTPEVIGAVSPLPALAFFARNGLTGFFVLAGVFLVVTGTEALYADMGHFGRRPIRLAWHALVLPGLVLNYFGQGALLLHQPEAIASPFYLLAPSWALYPLVALATVATVVASQAVISGAFSLTSQALELGYCPRVEIRHTSAAEIGQIYVPFVNFTLLFATTGLVVGFGSSSALAGAYGVAVSTTMVITSLLAWACSRRVWHWSSLVAGAVWIGFLVCDVAFFGANLSKLDQGGWLPLVVAAVVYLLFATWHRGRTILRDELRRGGIDFEQLGRELDGGKHIRVPGTAVYLESNPERVPRTFLHNFKHNKVIHEHVVFLNIQTEEIPRVPPSERLEVENLEGGVVLLRGRYGYMERPNVPTLLRQASSHGLEYDPQATTFVLGRETLVVKGRRGMPRWRGRLFARMAQNARRATLHFRIPPNRVIEIGAQVDL